MRAKTIELTYEQLKELEDFIQDVPNSKSYVYIAQLKIKDNVKGWNKTHIQICLLTGENAEACTNSVNFHVKEERNERKQLEIE